MAENKNFTMKEYNGTDYDTLYPETNSGQVLLDSTAKETLNLSGNPTVDDGFNEIAAGGAFRVGDVLTTARTNLGDKWLLCNGDEFDSSEYPDLANILPAPSLDNSNLWSESTANKTMSGFNGDYPPFYMRKIGSNYFIVGGQNCSTPQWTTNPTSASSWTSAPDFGTQSGYTTMVDVDGNNDIIYATNRKGQLYTLDADTLAATQVTLTGATTGASFIVVAGDKIVLGSQYNNGYNWYIMDDSGQTTLIMDGTPAYLYGGYAVGSKIYTANGYVVDINNRSAKSLRLNPSSNKDKCQYYYYDGWYYVHLYESGGFYQSSNGVNFTLVGTHANVAMTIIKDNILIGNNTYQMTSAGAKKGENNSSNINSNVLTSQEIVYQNTYPLLSFNTDNNKLNVRRFAYKTTTPIYSPASYLYAYIKAKK